MDIVTRILGMDWNLALVVLVTVYFIRTRRKTFLLWLMAVSVVFIVLDYVRAYL